MNTKVTVGEPGVPPSDHSTWSGTSVKPPRVIPAGQAPSPTLYVDVPGVLHPSESTYELVCRRSPWTDGHSKYEGVRVLDDVLMRWPDVKIILTSVPNREEPLQSALSNLGPLAMRVVGRAYEDLTTQVKREVGTRSGATRTVGYSSEDYWRMSKAEIVATHVAWSNPERWTVIDAEDILWPIDVRRERLVLTDPCIGLQSAQTLDRLQTVLFANFGR